MFLINMIVVLNTIIKEVAMKKFFAACGAFNVLGAVFVCLKIGGVITWPWLYVLSPFWIPITLVLIAAIIKEVSDM